MSAWGTGLYQNDTGADLKERFKIMIRFPIPLDEIIARLIHEFGITQEDKDTDFWLALADLLHRYGFHDRPEQAMACDLIRSGADQQRLRDLEMSEGDLRKRARLTDTLISTWSVPHPKPLKIRKLPGPESLVFQPNELWRFPTRNALWEADQPDGFGHFLCIDAWHHDDFFARYLILVCWPDANRQMLRPMQVETRNLEYDDTAQKARRVRRWVTALMTLKFDAKSGRRIKALGLERVGAVACNADDLRALPDPRDVSMLTNPNGFCTLEHALNFPLEAKDMRIGDDRTPLPVRGLPDGPVFPLPAADAP